MHTILIVSPPYPSRINMPSADIMHPSIATHSQNGTQHNIIISPHSKSAQPVAVIA